MQYLLELIIINIESICPQLIEGIADVKDVRPISSEEGVIYMDWYQPNDTEEMYLSEQIDFEIDEEKDVEILTAKRSINIPATTLALFEYTKVLRKLNQELDNFISEEGSK